MLVGRPESDKGQTENRPVHHNPKWLSSSFYTCSIHTQRCEHSTAVCTRAARTTRQKNNTQFWSDLHYRDKEDSEQEDPFDLSPFTAEERQHPSPKPPVASQFLPPQFQAGTTRAPHALTPGSRPQAVWSQTSLVITMITGSRLLVPLFSW